MSFANHVLEFKPALAAFARRLQQNGVDAEDLVQETIFRALKNEDKFQPGTNLKSWLFTIMRNQFNTQYGLRKREAAAGTDDIGLQLTCLPDQDWAVYQAEAERVISHMPAERRSALLQVSAGISYEEAAITLGCEVGTIKSRVNRARATLISELGDIFTSRDAYTH
jgi:RNA polymerase sigma-70 factor (ECF subfamily)